MVLPVRDFLRVVYVALLMGGASLHAHDLYLLPNTFKVVPRTQILITFNNGDSFPESESAPSLARLKDAQLQSSKGVVAIGDLRTDGKRVVGLVHAPEQHGSLLLSAHTAPNLIELASDKFLEYIKEEGLTRVIDWRAKHGETLKPWRERYSKFAKSLLTAGAPDDFFRHAVGFPIEIIPEANPYMLRPGTDLPVRVLFHGNPAVGLQLEAAWSSGTKSKTTIIGRTDKEGRILVPITAVGKWRLHSLLMERCAEPSVADWESFWASFTFEIH